MSGTFSIEEVKQIVNALESKEEEVGNMKKIIVGIIFLSICGFAAMFGITMVANEVSKDSRPDETGAMMDNEGNLVATGTEAGDGNMWNTAVTDLGGALSAPDAQPVYTLDTLTDSELGRINSLTVDISPATDGSHLRVYRVQAVEIQRPAPGASGNAIPPTVTVYTVKGDTMSITNSIATISDSTGTDFLTLSAADAAGRRRRRRRRRMQEAGVDTSDYHEAPFEHIDYEEAEAETVSTAAKTTGMPSARVFNERLQFQASKHPLFWNDVTQTSRRNLKDQDALGNAFVRRAPSDTSFVFELQQRGKGTDFDSHHHGIGDGSILSLPLCTDEGKLHDFKLEKADTMMHLEEKFPMLKHFHATEVGGIATADITLTNAGVRAQIWVGHEERCYVDPHSSDRADTYTIYGANDHPAEADHEERNEVQTKLDDLQLQFVEPGAPNIHTEPGSKRRLTDKSDLIYPPPAGPTTVRTYEMCVAVSPNYIEYAETDCGDPTSDCLNLNDGAMGLILTTVARASGVWRRAVGISLVLCRKQDLLLTPTACQTSDPAAPGHTTNGGCGSEECFCQPVVKTWDDIVAREPDTCGTQMDGVCDVEPGFICDDGYSFCGSRGGKAWCHTEQDRDDCGLNATTWTPMTPAPETCKPLNNCRDHDFSGTAVGGKCYKDAAASQTQAACNAVPDNDNSGFINSGYAWMQKMGVGTEDYDIAHYFSRVPQGVGGGGGLGWCCACNGDTGPLSTQKSSKKAGGATSLSKPSGDAFTVGFVAHELGHQFAHGHTFAGVNGGCEASNFLPNEAVELGSGRSILSYSGVCGDDDTDQGGRYPGKTGPGYFASVSLGFFSKGQNDPNWQPSPWSQPGVFQSCGTVETTTNNRPTVEVVSQCEIPLGTPYELYGSATDPDAGDVLTYNWEQIDAAVTQKPVTEENTGTPGVAGSGGPLVISVPPTVDGFTRTVPDLQTAMQFRGLQGDADPRQRLSSIARDMHFSLTVRDGFSVIGSQLGAPIMDDLDSPGGHHSVGSWDAKVTTVHVSTAGPLIWTHPMPPQSTMDARIPDMPADLCDFYTDFFHNNGRCDAGIYDGCPAGPGSDIADCHTGPPTCELLARSKYPGRWNDAVQAAWHACVKANDLNHTIVNPGPFEFQFMLAGANPNATTPLTNATYSLQYKAGPSAEIVEGLVDQYGIDGEKIPPTPWAAVPGAEHITMHRNGLGAHTVHVPDELSGLFVVLRVVADTGAVTPQAGCRAFALSPTFEIGHAPGPGTADFAPPTQWLSVYPEIGATDLTVEHVHVIWYFDGPIYRSGSLATATNPEVIILEDGAPSRAAYSFDILPDHVVLSIHDNLAVGANIEITIGGETLSETPGATDGFIHSATAQFTTASAATAAVTPAPVAPTVVQTDIDTTGSITLVAHFDMAVVGVHNTFMDVIARGNDPAPNPGAANATIVCSVQLDHMDGANVDGMNGTIHGLANVCDLWPGFWYDVRVPGSALVSAVGNGAFAADIMWQFRTSEDSMPPQIVQTLPHEGETHVPEGVGVAVFFDKPVRVNEICANHTDPESAAAAMCADECASQGFCCNDFTIGSNQLLSCAQACMIRMRGAEQPTCEAVCHDRAANRGCSTTHDGFTYGHCASCDDLDATCPHGVQSSAACEAGCAMGNPCELVITSDAGEYMTVPMISGVTDATLIDVGDEHDTGINLTPQTHRLYLPAPHFSDLTLGYSSRTTYTITLAPGGVIDLAGNDHPGGALSFMTGDSHPPHVVNITGVNNGPFQMDFEGPIVAVFILDDDHAMLQPGQGTFNLIDVNTGQMIDLVDTNSDNGFSAVQFMAGRVTVNFDGSNAPADVPLAIRWTAAAMSDDYNNGISGFPRMYTPDGSMDDPNRYMFHTTSAPPPPPAPRTAREYGNCWNFVMEEQYLTQFEVVATEDMMTLEWQIDMTVNETAYVLQEVLQPERYTIPEIMNMTGMMDLDGDGFVTSEEYVVFKCPCEPDVCLPECAAECPDGVYEPPPPPCRDVFYGKTECDADCGGMAFVAAAGICTECEQGDAVTGAPGARITQDSVSSLQPAAVMCDFAPGCGGSAPLSGRTECDAECAGLAFFPADPTDAALGGVCSGCDPVDGETLVSHMGTVNICPEPFPCDALPDICTQALLNLNSGVECCGCATDGTDAHVDPCLPECMNVPDMCHEVVQCPGVCDGVVEMAQAINMLEHQCPTEAADCFALVYCTDEFMTAVGSDQEPTAGTPSFMALVECATSFPCDPAHQPAECGPILGPVNGGGDCCECDSGDPCQAEVEACIADTTCIEILMPTDGSDVDFMACQADGLCNVLLQCVMNNDDGSGGGDNGVVYGVPGCAQECAAVHDSDECGQALDCLAVCPEPFDCADPFPECAAPLATVNGGSDCCGCMTGDDANCPAVCHAVPAQCQDVLLCDGMCTAAAGTAPDTCDYQNDQWCDAEGQSTAPYCEAGSDVADCDACATCDSTYCVGCDYPADGSLPGTPMTVGCTDPNADNYDPTAGSDDSSCTYPSGCTDWNADNYDPTAMMDNYSCTYPEPEPEPESTCDPTDTCCEQYPFWVNDGYCDAGYDWSNYCVGDYLDCGEAGPAAEPAPGDDCPYQDDQWCDGADRSSAPYCAAGTDVNDCDACATCDSTYCLGCSYPDGPDSLPGVLDAAGATGR